MFRVPRTTPDVERQDGTFLIDGQIRFYVFLTHFNKTVWINEGENEFDWFILHLGKDGELIFQV